MTRPLLILIGSIFSAAAYADPPCFPVGTTLAVRGQPVLSSESRSQPVWMLSMNPPLCLIDRQFSNDTYGRVLVDQLQLIGPPPPTGVLLTVTGAVMRRNTPQYYMMPTSFAITPLRKNAPR